METQKIINLLNDSSNEESKFATKRWYIIDSPSKAILFSLNQKLLNQVFVILMHLITENITVEANNSTDVAFNNCAPLSTCTKKINDVFVDEVNHIYIAMPMYNLIEYRNNYSNTSGSLWQFKRDEVPTNNADLTIDNSQSFKYKAALLGKTAKDNDGKSF